MAFPFKGVKKAQRTAMYQLTGIPRDTWRIFSAKCKLRGKTIKETLLEFIEKFD